MYLCVCVCEEYISDFYKFYVGKVNKMKAAHIRDLNKAADSIEYFREMLYKVRDNKDSKAYKLYSDKIRSIKKIIVCSDVIWQF